MSLNYRQAKAFLSKIILEFNLIEIIRALTSFSQAECTPLRNQIKQYFGPRYKIQENYTAFKSQYI